MASVAVGSRTGNPATIGAVCRDRCLIGGHSVFVVGVAERLSGQRRPIDGREIREAWVTGLLGGHSGPMDGPAPTTINIPSRNFFEVLNPDRYSDSRKRGSV
jgi:hypothetical protein